MQRKKTSFKNTFLELQNLGFIELLNLIAGSLNRVDVNIDEIKCKIDKNIDLFEQRNCVFFLSNLQNNRKTIYVSPNSTEITGYSPKEFIEGGTSFFHEIYCQADKKSAYEYLKIIAIHQRKSDIRHKKDYIYTTTFRLFTKKGYYRWMHSSWVFYIFKNNRPFISASVLTDIDDIKTDDYSDLNICKYDHNTKQYITERIESRPPYGLNLINEKELFIIKRLSEGFTNDEIAASLKISGHKVKDIRKKLLKKTWCSNITELIYQAYRNKLITL